MKKVAVKTIENITKVVVGSPETVEWNGIEVIVKHSLDFYEMLTFVDKVVSLCFKEDGGYLPETKDFAVRACTVAMYSNVNMPNDPAKNYEVLECSGLFEMIISRINRTQFENMLTAIDSKIDAIVDASIMDSRKKLEDATNAMIEMLGKVNSLFEGIDNVDMTSVVNALKDGAVDEKRIVEEYMDIKYGSMAGADGV